jgi:hypothetical protein
MKRGKEMRMADLWVTKINGRMEEVKKLYTAVLTKVVQLIWIYQLKKRLDLPKNSVNFADSICRINLSLPNCV